MLFSLLRAHQWYKNLLIFLPLFFAGLFFTGSIFRVGIGFALLCIVSSANYILNDVCDVKKDRAHPEKKNRLIASGRINVVVALILAVLMYGIGLFFARMLSFDFYLWVLIFVSLTQLYTLKLKYVLFADVIMISLNFLIRTYLGVLVLRPVLNIPTSPWLILLPFFLALFLTVAKRYSNVLFLKDFSYNPLLKFYTPQISRNLMFMFSGILIVLYVLYCIDVNPYLISTVPLVLFALLTFTHRVESGQKVGRELGHAFFDVYLLGSFILWSLMSFGILYLF